MKSASPTVSAIATTRRFNQARLSSMSKARFIASMTDTIAAELLHSAIKSPMLSRPVSPLFERLVS